MVVLTDANGDDWDWSPAGGADNHVTRRFDGHQLSFQEFFNINENSPRKTPVLARYERGTNDEGTI
jgi:hypothetical protein